MSDKDMRIKKRLALYAQYEQELRDELEKAFVYLTPHDRNVLIEREIGDEETHNIVRSSREERSCFLPDHPNATHNDNIHTNTKQ